MVEVEEVTGSIDNANDMQDEEKVVRKKEGGENSNTEKEMKGILVYVSPYEKQAPQDPIHFFILVASLLCFFFKFKIFGWVGVYLAASGLANFKYKGDYSAFSQMLVAIMSTIMVYVQEAMPPPPETAQ
eukprot:m.5443 g.5443  ORF g.5443 m.5443 type:complete len:129 (+) comp2405_c0_seq1:54-440(+)